MTEQSIGSSVLANAIGSQPSQPSQQWAETTPNQISSQKTKNPIFEHWAFKVFVKRYFVFLVIAVLGIIGLNKALSFFSWDKYMQDFYNLANPSYFVKNNNPKNNVNELKQDLFYNVIDTLLEKERTAQWDKSLYRFQFTLWDISRAFWEVSSVYKSQEIFKQNFREFWNILWKIEHFENSKLLTKWWVYEAKKVFKVKKDKYSFVFDYLQQDNEYLIKFYDIQFANAANLGIFKPDIENILLNKNYIIKITKKNIILYYQKNKKNVEIARYTIKTKKITNQMWWKWNPHFTQFLEDFTKSFAQRKTLYWIENRNLFIVHPPKQTWEN